MKTKLWPLTHTHACTHIDSNLSTQRWVSHVPKLTSYPQWQMQTSLPNQAQFPRPSICHSAVILKARMSMGGQLGAHPRLWLPLWHFWIFAMFLTNPSPVSFPPIGRRLIHIKMLRLLYLLYSTVVIYFQISLTIHYLLSPHRCSTHSVSNAKKAGIKWNEWNAMERELYLQWAAILTARVNWSSHEISGWDVSALVASVFSSEAKHSSLWESPGIFSPLLLPSLCHTI